MRRAARTDGNQADVIQWYEGLGYQVINTSGVGGGFPDLIAVKPISYDLGGTGIHYDVILVEVKRSKYAKYTEAQKKFNAQFPGLVIRVETVEDVIRSVENA